MSENTDEKRAVIFNIQKFSVHDGPGIRTTVFMKGCPLDCKWCHNPESKRKDISLIIDEEKCTNCGLCYYNCKNEAIQVDNKHKYYNDENRCVFCGECVFNCLSDAREIIGKYMTVGEIVDTVLEDKIFYDTSGGGVTISGGEPLYQPEVLLELLKKLKCEHIRTAVDTSGFAKFDILKEIAEYTDLFLYDLKIMDDEKHKKYVGVSNELIIDNLKKLSKIHNNINIRLILIDGLNSNIEHIDAVVKVLASTNIKNINLLPYHDISRHKYRKLNLTYEGEDFSVPDEEKIKEIQNYLIDQGFSVKIGG